MQENNKEAEEKPKKNNLRSAIIEQTKSLPVKGFVNAIKFEAEIGGDGEGRFLSMFVAVGREHRLGRWEVVRDAENCVFVTEVECG